MSQQEGTKRTVHIAPATSAVQLDVRQVLEDIERIKKEIEEVQHQNIDESDPEFKENAKKLMQIKKFLTKKTKSHETTSKGNFWKKLKTIRQRRGYGSQISLEPTPSEILESYGSSERRSSGLFNYPVDEAFMYGAECVLALMDILKSSK